MGNKKFHPTYNRGKQEKELLNRLQKQQKLRVFLATNFEDRSYVLSDDSVKFAVLKLLVYVFSENQKEYVKSRFREALNQLMKVNLFQNNKLLNNIKNGNLSGAYTDISKIMKREYGRIPIDFMDIAYSTLNILIEYFGFEEYILGYSDYLSFFEDYCFYAFVLVLEEVVWISKIDYEKGKNIDEDYVSDYLDYFEKEKEKMKVYKFDSNLLTPSFSNQTNLSVLADIVNLYVHNWFCDKELKGKTLIDYPTEKITVDGTEKDFEYFKNTLLKVCPKDYKVRCDNKSLYHRIKDIISLNFLSISSSVVDYVLYEMIQGVMTERFNSYNEEIKRISEQSKTLITTNRQLSKTLGKVEKELEEKGSEIANLTEELQSVTVTKENNAELEKLVVQVKDFEGIRTNLESDLSKAQSKIDWQESKIAELTDKLSFYDSIEDDLASVQNENAALISAIEKIESWDTEDDSIFEDKYNAIKDLPILFVGGKNNMLAKFKKEFPNSEFIDIDDGFNFNTAGRFEYAVVFTRVVSHAQCGRLSSQMPKERIFNINTCNLRLMVDEIYRLIKGNENLEA